MSGTKIVLIVTACIAACLVNARADKKSQELETVLRALQPIFEKLDPKPAVQYPENAGGDLVITFLPQTYTIHSRSKSGEFSTKTYNEVGPSFRGFVLRLGLQQKGVINQAVTPTMIREPYWSTYLDVSPIEKTDKQVFWRLSFSGRTSTSVLDGIHRALKQVAGESGPRARPPVWFQR